MQIRTTSRYQNGYYQKRQEKTNVGENVEKKESLVHYWSECKLVQPLWKNNMKVPQKIKKSIELLFLL